MTTHQHTMRRWFVVWQATAWYYSTQNGTLRRGPCAWCCGPEPCEEYRAPAANERRRFYLHSPVDYSDLLRCMEARGVDDRPDDTLGAEGAALMIDFYILKSLRTHPARTLDPARAYLHVMDFPFYASYVSSKMLDCYDGEDKLAAAVAAFPERWRAFPNATWLVINGDWQPPDLLFGCLWLALHGEDAPKTWVYAVVDRLTALAPAGGREERPCGAGPAPNFVVVPYVAHHEIERRSLASGCDDWPARPTSVMFHGTMKRTHSGRYRRKALVLAEDLEAADIADVAVQTFPGAPTRVNASTIMYRTAQTYAASRFCLAPEGDTNTSRRVFDSLAAGCVPVVFAQDCLPFRDLINYSDFTLEAGPLRCCSQHKNSTRDWFRDRLTLHSATDPDDERLYHRLACEGKRVFRDFLSYRNGAATNSLLARFSIFD